MDRDRPSSAAATRSAAADWEWALIDVGIVLLFVALPHAIFSDATVRYAALSDLLESGTVSPTPYSLVGPLASAPLYLLGKVSMTSLWWCARFNTLVFAAGLLATWGLLRSHVDGNLLRKFLLVLLAGSMFPNHLRGYFGEVFSAVLIAVGILAVHFGRSTSGWIAIVLGVVNTPACIVGLAIIGIKQVWDTRRLRFLIPVAAAAALIALESWIRRGNPLITGYEGNKGAATILTYSGQPGFSYPLAFGVLSIVLSFGKGLVFFAPGLLLPIRRYASSIGERLRATHTAWLLFLAGMILVYAKWWAWYGGWTWGPRFFVIASVPAALAIAVRLVNLRNASSLELAILLAVLTVSVWVGFEGAVFDQRGLDVCRDYDREFLCWYAPEFSALWRPFVQPAWPAADDLVLTGYFIAAYACLAAPVVNQLTRTTGQLIAEMARGARLRSWRF